ncbi:MAG: hypothetical protein JF588_14365 [Caulobacterales bacterium]|nr:hypothetical protein [Caulobacterales bacterium]
MDTFKIYVTPDTYQYNDDIQNVDEDLRGRASYVQRMTGAAITIDRLGDIAIVVAPNEAVASIARMAFPYPSA